MTSTTSLIEGVDKFDVDGQVVVVGGIYSFRTAPYTEFSPPHATRYAALKILGRSRDHAFYVVLNGVFNSPPNMDQVLGLSPLSFRRFPGTRNPYTNSFAILGSFLDESISLDEFQFVMRTEVSEDERSLVQWNTGTGRWRNASTEAEGEWRWKHDRQGLEEEVDRYKAAQDAKFAAQEERLANRLKGLTWEKLLSETIFEKWGEPSALPPPEFTAAARDQIRAAIVELQSVGAKPRKAKVRSVLRACVEWFNAADENFGGVIETVERDDILEALEEIAYVARHKSPPR
ncbi:MAG: hypothetical protein ACI89J_004116 [Hyphomicrobiaceae bacterium]|jgi:hypothetical protein